MKQVLLFVLGFQVVSVLQIRKDACLRIKTNLSGIYTKHSRGTFHSSGTLYMISALSCDNKELPTSPENTTIPPYFQVVALGDNGVCFENLACYPQEEPWVSPMRPLPNPDSPENIGVGFYLLTRNTMQSETITNNQITLNPDYTPNLISLDMNDYQPRRLITVFIIHGYLASIESKWMVEMAAAYLTRTDGNIFLVGWGNGANNMNYLQVTANVRVVQDIVAKFIKTLVEKTNLYLLQVHCLGHSLGAHICGVAGKRNPGIYRCTGMDPASPGFEGYSDQVRLNNTDCSFVDVLHTNGEPIFPTLGLGYISELGKVDFYFNGGKHQPQCIVPQLPKNINESNFLTLPVNTVSTYMSCSHSKSIEYMTEAIGHPECVIWGHKQNPLDKTLNVVTQGTTQRITPPDQCSLDSCSPVGLETFLFPARGSFYVATNLKSPYCRAEPENTMLMKVLLQYFYNRHRILRT